MRLCVCLVFVVSSLGIATCQVPDVYDFCNALFRNDRKANSAPIGCDARCPQGPPGKRGPEGRKGSSGSKGEQGEEGKCDELKSRIDKLESLFYSILVNNPDNSVDICGLGMKNGVIRDSAITASSQWDDNWAGNKGRLDNPTHCWHAKSAEVGEWIQIDLGKPTAITGVVTQGRPTSRYQWVKSYKIACAINLRTWIWFKHNGVEKIFTGNTDTSTKVVNFLPTTMSCRYIRLYPHSWNLAICMRMELLGEGCLHHMP